jgi:hypothetical protein
VCTLAEAEGLTDIKVADWSNEVAPFWAEVSCQSQQQQQQQQHLKGL